MKICLIMERTLHMVQLSLRNKVLPRSAWSNFGVRLVVETTLIAYHEATRELVVIEGVIAPPFLFLISKMVIHSEEGGGGWCGCNLVLKNTCQYMFDCCPIYTYGRHELPFLKIQKHDQWIRESATLKKIIHNIVDIPRR